MPGAAPCPIIDYSQLQRDHQRALEQTPFRRAYEQLPAYSEAIMNKAAYQVREKDVPSQPKSSSKMSSLESMFKSEQKSTSSQPMSTWKAIITGDVQRHHPMYRLEESVDPRLSPRHASQS